MALIYVQISAPFRLESRFLPLSMFLAVRKRFVWYSLDHECPLVCTLFVRIDFAACTMKGNALYQVCLLLYAAS
ncbi:unnamed protein product [Strongylus vulgaris]|uniref:Uncharacterized protein n=1 Tax=Strongylus vulgaris TaxID=40348 RepID=A0A3P7K0D2_STRVU|nr:unnamed protein product [Strongylus vulgaris]